MRLFTAYKFKKIGYRFFNKMIKYRPFRIFCYPVAYSPLVTNKQKNAIINLIERENKKSILKSLPYNICLNVSNLCNYRCKFCEIHYFYHKAQKDAGKVFPNSLTIDFVKNFKNLFEKCSNIELTGATGEPFINKHFLEISDYLTNKLGVFCTATTNGALITDEIAEKLCKIKFGSLLFSIHAANKKVYKEYQGGDMNKIFNNIKKIQDYKKKYNSKFPIIGVNFLICKENTDGIFDFLDKLKELNIDFLNINHYYDSRNKLQKGISYYFDREIGDKLVKKIYDYAHEINLKLSPANPPLLNKDNEESASNIQIKQTDKCSCPFNTIKFKGAVEFENCNYISVYNRILLFKLNYKEFFEEHNNIYDIWSHELMQYFRETVGKNPICKFCKDSETPQVRCIDYVKYSERRDKAVKDFFVDFNKKYPSYKKIKGLQILSENPYAYKENDNF